MHPLKVAYTSAGFTQETLAKEVNKLRWRRPNGRPLRVTPGFISQICTGYRTCGVQLAKAFADALDRPELAALILLPPSQSNAA